MKKSNQGNFIMPIIALIVALAVGVLFAMDYTNSRDGSHEDQGKTEMIQEVDDDITPEDSAGDPSEEKEDEEETSINEGNEPDEEENNEPENETLENIYAQFKSDEITVGDAVYNRIYGKSYQDNPYIGLEDLRYLTIPYYDFNHEIQVGEMIVNAAIAEDTLGVFSTLFDNEYEINSIRLIDDFWTGDGTTSDDASIAANNTSAFCYRVVTGGSSLSNHAYGMAIDINPYQNPYYYLVNGEPTDMYSWDWDYLDRSSGADHMILKGDICESTFSSYGFSWGGDWSNPVDYQHFEKTQ